MTPSVDGNEVAKLTNLTKFYKDYNSRLKGIFFKAAALLADAFYVRQSVCPCACVSVHFWGTV